MSHSIQSTHCLTVVGLLALAVAALPGAALAKTYEVDCTKNGKLQNTIDSTGDGDVIEITGVCQENIVIRDKALTLVGMGTGPNGITGVAQNTDAVRIEHSLPLHDQDTVLQNLSISNPNFTCVRILYQSVVDMIDVEVNNCWSGAATAIWVQDGSKLWGTRLTLNNNLRGLGATDGARAWCYECKLNGNINWAASAHRNSLVTLLDSAVSGDRGLLAIEKSYIDLDCISHDSLHACSLSASGVAGFAYFQSTVAFYAAGDFHGDLTAGDRSKMWLLGARQQSNPGANSIDDDSTLRVESLSGDSKVIGQTIVTGFSNAQFYGAGTVLDGNLNCDSGGDAFVEAGIVLTNYTIVGCSHAP